MSNMINSAPRFGVETVGDVVRIFDYATGSYWTVTGEDTVIESVDGQWDANELVRLIQSSQQIDEAFVGDLEEREVDEVEEGKETAGNRRRVDELLQTRAAREHREEVQADKVKQAAADFNAEFPEGHPDKVDKTGTDFLTDSPELRQQRAIDKTDAAIRAGASQESQQHLSDAEKSAEEQRRIEAQRRAESGGVQAEDRSKVDPVYQNDSPQSAAAPPRDGIPADVAKAMDPEKARLEREGKGQ